jgi:hypothetical protein
MKTYCALLLTLCCLQAVQAQENSRSGTVCGTVLDAETHAPVAGARIYLLTTKLCKISGAKVSVRTSHGDYLLPHYQRAERQVAADAQGAFILHDIPARAPFKSSTIFIKAPGYGYFVIHDARIYPDAAMSLKIDCRLKKGSPYAEWFEGTDKDAPFSYGQVEK